MRFECFLPAQVPSGFGSLGRLQATIAKVKRARTCLMPHTWSAPCRRLSWSSRRGPRSSSGATAISLARVPGGSAIDGGAPRLPGGMRRGHRPASGRPARSGWSGSPSGYAPMKHSMAPAPGDVLNRRASGSIVEARVALERRSPRKSASALRLRRGAGHRSQRMPRRDALLKIDVDQQRSRHLVRSAHCDLRPRSGVGASCSAAGLEAGTLQRLVKGNG